MVGISVDREKPTDSQGKFVPADIGRPSDKSLFGFVVKKLLPTGWLASDDGSIELTCPRVFGPSIGRMKKSRYTEEQIVGILRETDRDPVATVAKRHGVSEQAIYTWKKRFGSFQPDDVRRLKQLEQENGRLKKLVAERDLEIEVMKEIAAKKW